jgi:tetratricopeptide (TPR) repeat protein
MAIRDKGLRGASASEHKNFTDRDRELAIFERLLDLDEPAHLPALMFFGVGGTGKSWLLKRFRRLVDDEPTLAAAWIDFDRKSGGPSYVSDFSTLLAELWRQLDVECPRFETAYAWMRFKQSAGDRPLVRHSGKFSTGWEFVKEGLEAGFNWIPGVNLVTWAADKLGKAAVARVQKTSLGRHLLTQAGNDDYLHLSRMTAQEIYPTLATRLGEDLDEQLPTRKGKRCRAVVFLDTFEDVSGGEQNEARRQVAEEPVRELYAHLTCALLVMFGRDRLNWSVVDPEWADPANLEQHPLGGLSRQDATAFLGKCGIEPGPLLEAILRVARDERIPDRKAYYPFSLSLCADTVLAGRSRGIELEPDTFDMAPGDYGALAQRFLKSLHDEHPEHWIFHLAQTPRFDEPAARAAFSPTRDIHQEAAWESLRDYSFVQETLEPGWLGIHSVVSDVLRRQLAGNRAGFARAHADWHAYWQSRSLGDTDEFAALAWYHDYVRDPQQALAEWNEKAERVRARLNMTSHLDLLNWWTPTEIEERRPRMREEAAALVSLGVELASATLGNRSINLRRAIACYEAALRVYTESDLPAEWAMTRNNLGIACSNLPTGDRGENLRRAIACYEAALRVYTQSGFPVAWATTQNNLGNAYRNLPTGDKGENLRRAIACYEAALLVYIEPDFPAAWAMTQNNLGNAYENLPTGDRGENLRRAAACYMAARRVYTESDFPIEWAMTQHNLGAAYSDLPTGDRGENLRRAIACYLAALRVRTESDFPAGWAMTQNNLGNVYIDLPTGDRAENLRRAIGCYLAALRVRTESDFPAAWATTQNNLGNAYRHLPTGNRGENLRRAIACHEAALRVYTESDFPADWAMTQNNLANACRNLPTGDRGENLRRAIGCYEAALRVYTQSGFPADWALTQNNLGAAYRNLPAGDRGENLRHAIACYEAALRVYTESDFPAAWAMTQNNLAIAYRNLPAGDRALNLRRAIACYEAALRVYTESDFPAAWAMTQNNLGNAYRNLPTRDRDENLRRAIDCYLKALRVRTETDFPAAWAVTQNNLGNAYRNLPTGDRAENLRRAIACYEAALGVRTESDFPADWAGTQFNLGLALRDGERFEESARAFEAAARGYEIVGDAIQADEARAEFSESRRQNELETAP